MKALFHVDEMEKWEMALANVGNMVNDCHAASREYEIEVMANSLAVKGYVKAKDGQLAQDMADLSAQGVAFVACNNSLKGLGIAPTSLHGFVQVVPAGVVEAAMKQSEGFAYIKP